VSKLTYASEVVAHLPGPSAQDDSYRSLPVDATIGGIVTDDPRGGFILLPLSLTYDEMEGACREQCAAARLYYLSAALIDVDERTSRLPSGLRSATRYWMPRSAHWVRLISLSPSSFTK
jgi:hypothetical protein